MARLVAVVCCLASILALATPAAAQASDTAAPEVGLTTPITGGSVTLVGNIVPVGFVDLSGPVSDDTGVAHVRVQLQRLSDRLFWTGTEWQSAPAWNEAALSAETWTVPAVDFAVPGLYSMRFSTLDTVGNWSSVKQNPRLRLAAVDDTTAPTGQFLYEGLHQILLPPEPTVFVSESPFMEGSYYVEVLADDDIGVARVVVQVQRNDPRAFWNGTDWQPEPAWVPTAFGGRSTLTPWRTVTPIDFDEAGAYTVRMNLRDLAGNVSTAAANQKMTVQIVADEALPLARMTAPFWDYSILPGDILRSAPSPRPVAPGIQRVAGQAFDEGVGVASVRVQIERTDTRAYWNGSAWQASPVWVAARLRIPVSPNTVGWQLDRVDLTAPGDYAVRLSATDLAGNRSGSADNWKSFFTVA